MHKERKIFSLFILIYVLAIVTLAKIDFSTVEELSIELKVDKGKNAQIFYNTGAGFNKNDSKTFQVIADNTYHTYRIPLPRKQIFSIRIDPITNKGAFRIKEIDIITKDDVKTYKNKELAFLVTKTKDVKILTTTNSINAISIGNDPYLIFDIQYKFAINYAFKLFIFFGITFLTILFYKIQKKINYKHIQERLNIFAKRLNTANLISFDFKSVIFLGLMFFLFIFSVFFKLNGSSLAIWNTFKISDEKVQSNILLGIPQGIRSDEWGVLTPLTLSQYYKDFPKTNTNVGTGTATMLSFYDLPVKTWSAIVKPQNYGYFILDIERAFSFNWSFKIFGTLISLFLLFMLLTKSNFWLSILGSFWIFYSSFMQWWFSVPLPEMLMASSFMIVFFIYFLYSQSKIQTVVFGLLTVLFTLDYILILYPAFQILIGYLSLIIIFLFLIQENKFNIIKKNLVFKSILLFILLSITIMFIIWFYTETKETIEIIMNTSYPGARELTGGGFPFIKIFDGFYNVFISASHFPKVIYGNVCSSSSYILLFPLAVILMIKNYLQCKKISILEIGLLTYIFIVLIWMYLGFNLSVAKISLFSMIPVNRAKLGLGLASIILVILVLSNIQKNTYSLKNNKVMYILISFTFLIQGFILHQSDVFYTYKYILFVSILFTIVSYLILNKKIKYLIFTFLLILLPSTKINPIQYGLKPLIDNNSEFISKIKSINDDSEKQWLVYGNFWIPNLLKANGLNVFNGVNYTPKPILYNLFKSEKEQIIINRYAHIQFKYTDFKPSIKLKQSDVYTVSINPCSKEINRMGIQFILLPKDIQFKKGKNCNLQHITFNNYYDVYELIDAKE